MAAGTFLHLACCTKIGGEVKAGVDTITASITTGPDEADLQRARLYALLAVLLARPPSADLLERLRGLARGTQPGAGPETGSETGINHALHALGTAAAATGPSAAAREYDRLFIGLQRGELVPYASWYLTGLLQDRPLAHVRADMARLGVARAPGVPEPEDHVAVLAETMAGLIEGRFGPPAAIEVQRDFFDRHLAPWATRFFAELEQAEAAVFYRPVGTLGRAFLDIEQEAFALDDG
jgi:TorA maturation chaperone TorD